MGRDPFDEAERAKANEAAKTKSQECVDFAKLLLGPEADKRDVERAALAFATLPKGIIVQARRAVQKAHGAPEPDPTPPSIPEVAEALLAHPGLAGAVVRHLAANVEKHQIGAGPWEAGDWRSRGWRRRGAWPDDPAVALVNFRVANHWGWETNFILPGSTTPIRDSGNESTCEEAKAKADAHLVAHGWVLAE